MLWDAKFKYGKDSAAARVLAVEDDVAAKAWLEAAGDPGSLETLCDAPSRGPFWRRSCKALAKAFSCVRTK